MKKYFQLRECKECEKQKMVNYMGYCSACVKSQKSLNTQAEEEIVYQNKWCKIVSKETIYILKSKSGKYNDQYFNSLPSAKQYIGVIS